MSGAPSQTEQFTTFYIGPDLFGIEVMKTQEVTGPHPIMPVPLAPDFVRGLINLRGQIATALGLRELFGTGTPDPAEQMSVVCRIDGNLVSLIVDAIGDVVEVSRDRFERAPETLPSGLKRFVKGVYKMNHQFLTIIDLETVSRELSPTLEPNTH